MEPAFEQFDMDLRRACSVETDSASADVKAVTTRPVREATDDPAGTLGKTSVSSIDVAVAWHCRHAGRARGAMAHRSRPAFHPMRRIAGLHRLTLHLRLPPRRAYGNSHARLLRSSHKARRRFKSLFRDCSIAVSTNVAIRPHGATSTQMSQHYLPLAPGFLSSYSAFSLLC
jgi:hypothetical protein